MNLNSAFISFILRDFSLSSQSFRLEKDHLALPFVKNTENLREFSSGNKQNKLRVQVMKFFLILFCFFGLTSCKKKEVSQELIRPVLTQTVQASEKKSTLHFSGVSKSAEQLHVSFRIGGQITALPIKVGEQIKSGTLIAQLDDHDCSLRCDQAQAASDEAEAQLKNAQSYYHRLKLLYESESTSRQELDTARTHFETAKALASQASKELELAETARGYASLTSEKTWEVAAKHAELHENVSPGQPIATLLSIGHLQVEIAVPESEIGLLSPGMQMDLFFSALPQERFVATVEEVGVSSGGDTTFPATLSLNEQDSRLRPGMAAKAEMEKPTFATSKRIWVPLEAIGHDASGHFVYLFDQGRAHKTSVAVGEISLDGIEIVSGLSEGQELIVAGLRFLTDQQKVR